jgi:hypothetical protein
MRLGHRTFGVIVSFAACVAPTSFGTAQAATVVAGASATVITSVVPEPVIVLSASYSASSPSNVTLTAVNVAARAESASLSGTVSMGDNAPVVAMQSSDNRPPSARSADTSVPGLVGNAHKLAVELTKADLASLGAVSVTLNYN